MNYKMYVKTIVGSFLITMHVMHAGLGDSNQDMLMVRNPQGELVDISQDPHAIACLSASLIQDVRAKKALLATVIDEKSGAPKDSPLRRVALNNYGAIELAENNVDGAIPYFQEAAQMGCLNAQENLKRIHQWKVSQGLLPVLTIDSQPSSADAAVPTIMVHNDAQNADSEIRQMIDRATKRTLAAVVRPKIAVAPVATSPYVMQNAVPTVEITVPAVITTPILQDQKAIDETSTIKTVDYTKFSDKQLRDAQKKNAQKLRSTTNDAELRTERSLIYTALLAKAKDTSQRVPLLKEMVDYGDIDAHYTLARHYGHNTGDTSRVQKRWELLKTAADNNHAGACYEFIAEGFASNDQAKKATAATYADRLFKDAMRMAQIKLDDAQKGTLYLMWARYALEGQGAKKADEKAACELYKKASECGNHIDAYEFAKLCFKYNDLAQARRQFGLVQGKYLSQALWASMMLDFASGKQNDKNILIQEIMKPFRGEAFYGSGLTDADMAACVAHPSVLKQWQKYADNGDARACFVLGLCAEKGWGKTDDQPDTLLAYNYYVGAIESLSIDSELKNDCIFGLRRLSSDGCVEASGYIEKHCSTQEEIAKRELAVAAAQEVRDLYAALQSEDAADLMSRAMQCSPAALTIVGKDLKSDDREQVRRANSILGIRSYYSALEKYRAPRAMQQGKQKKVIAEIRADAKNAIFYLEQAQNLGEYGVEGHLNKVRYIYGLLSDDRHEKESYILKAAQGGDVRACYIAHCICPLDQDVREAYLKKAVDAQIPGAELLSVQLALQDKQNAPDLQHIRTIILRIKSNLEQNSQFLDQDEKSIFYELSARLCLREGDKEGYIVGLRKAFELKCPYVAVDLASACIANKKYAEAREVLNKVPAHERDYRCPVIESAMNCVDNYNQKAVRDKFIGDYNCYLKHMTFQPRHEHLVDFNKALAAIHATCAPLSSNDEKSKQIEALICYQEKGRTKEAYALACASGQYSVETDILFYGCEGVPADQQQALEKLILAIQQYDQCQACNAAARESLRKKLEENLRDAKEGKIQAFKPTPKAASILEKLYVLLDSMRSSGNQEDQRMLSLIPPYMCEHFYAAQSSQKYPAKMLNAWLAMLKRDSVSKIKNEQVLYYEALNALHGKKSVSEIVSLLEKAAQAGESRAQVDLLMMYSGARTLHSGEKVKLDLDKATYWAKQIASNNAASDDAKVAMHMFMGHMEVAQMHEARCSNKQQEKNDAYKAALNHYQEALKKNHFLAIACSIKTHGDAGCKDKALEVYRQSHGNAMIWNNCVHAYPIAKDVVSINSGAAKDACVRLYHALNVEIQPGEDLELLAETLKDIQQFYQGLFAIIRNNPVLYGFNSLEDVIAIEMLTSNAVSRKIDKVKLAQMQAKMKNQPEGLKNMFKEAFKQ